MLRLTSGSTLGCTGASVSGTVDNIVEGIEASVLPPSDHPTSLQDIRQDSVTVGFFDGDTFESCSSGDAINLI